MKIYFAGTPGIRERNWQKVIARRLLSYWDIKYEIFRAVPFAFELIRRKNENYLCRTARRSGTNRI
jgi:hypothetical protein